MSADLHRWALPSPVGPLVAELDDAGNLVALGRAKVELPGRARSHPTIELLEAELGRYWAGEPITFTVPVAPKATPFEAKVWAELQRIPWGHSVSYGALAERIGSNARAVGQANGRNPVAIVIPCHRVLGKDGSLVGYAGGLDMKRALLRVERLLLL